MILSLILYGLFLVTNIFGVLFLKRIASALQRIADQGASKSAPE